MHWILLPFRRLSDYKGRSRRLEFWLFWLVALVLQMLTSYADTATGQLPLIGGMGPLTLALTVLFLVPAAMVGIRRLHDTGRAGWWMLLFGVPYAAWLSGEQSGAQGLITAIPLLLGSLILFVMLVQAGEPGDNRFGSDPKAGIAGEQASI